MSQAEDYKPQSVVAKSDGTSQKAKRRHLKKREFTIEREIQRPDGTKVTTRAKAVTNDNFEGLSVGSIEPPRPKSCKVLRPLRLVLTWLTGLDPGGWFQDPPDTEA